MPFEFNPFTGNFDKTQDTSGFATTELDNLGTTAVNADILPDTDNAWDLGSASARFREMNAVQFLAKDGNGTFDTNIANDLTTVMFGYCNQTNGGTATIKANQTGSFASGFSQATASGAVAQLYGTFSGCFAFGQAKSNAANKKAHLHALGYGDFTFGVAWASGDHAYITTTGQSQGSITGGYAKGDAYSGYTGGAYLRNLGAKGCLLWGSMAVPVAYSPSKIEISSGADGSFALGAATTYGSGYHAGGEILCTQKGGFAQGVILNTAYYTTTPGRVRSQAYGGFAQGAVNQANITASGKGSFSHGYGKSNDIVASGDGSFAVGDSTSGTITASATNSVQFGGIGTNALASSVQIGNAGLRLKGTTGAPGTPQNGDIWVNSNYVYIRSNGVTCKVVNATL